MVEELDFTILSQNYTPQPLDLDPDTPDSSSRSSHAMSFSKPSTPSSLSGDAHAFVQWQSEISGLRQRLLPLVAMEDSLALELSGGVSVKGGKCGVFVRSGWQALVTPSPSLSHLSWLSDRRKTPGRVTVIADLAARTLASLHEDITTLWRHPAVKRLIRLRQLRLDETAA